MAEVQWIKLTTDMFDNKKIRHIRHMPEGDSIVLIWIMLLTIAGRCNAGGMIFLTENIPYTTQLLSEELEFEPTVIEMSLRALEKFGMIIQNEEEFCIKNWAEYQNIEGLDKIREQTRNRVASFRKKQKQLKRNVTCNVTVTQCNATDKELDKEVDKEQIKNTEKNDLVVSKDTTCRTQDVQRVVDAWNSLGLAKIMKITGDTNRGKMLRARINDYGADKVIEAIERINKSSFLKGQNKNGWTISFDWFVKPNNFIKVIEGAYDEKKAKTQTQQMLDDSYQMMADWAKERDNET